MLRPGSLNIGKSGERGYFASHSPYGPLGVTGGAVRTRNLNNDGELRRFLSDAGVGLRSAEDAVSIRPDEGGAYLTDVLNRHKGKQGEKPAEPPNPMDRVRQAARSATLAEAVNRYVSAYRTGKYKDKGIAVEAGAHSIENVALSEEQRHRLFSE